MDPRARPEGRPRFASAAGADANPAWFHNIVAHPRELDVEIGTQKQKADAGNLRAGEIAAELYLSIHTVKTHMRHIYDKLGVHTRSEAVERAQTWSLLAPPAHRS